MAVKEKDNYETVKVTAKVARKDKDGKRVKEVVDGKKVTVYDEVEKEIKKGYAFQTACKKADVKGPLRRDRGSFHTSRQEEKYQVC